MPQPIYAHRPTACVPLLLRLLCLIGLPCLFIGWTTATVQAQSCEPYPSPHHRVGYNFTRDGNVKIEDYNVSQLGAGWYHDYTFHQAPSRPGGIRYHQMIRGAGRTTPAQIQQLLTTLGPVVDANPGALWILGNEPDRYGQDELTPAQYAHFYHGVYTFLKQRDPTSHVAIAGIVQPTPIRLRYLDMVLAAYQQSYGTTMPVDYWDVHNFILPENCDWGAGTPPGLEAYTSEGIACPTTLDDHGNLTIFKQQLRNFRQWMKSRGYQDHPLIVSEYGILLSKYHGYDYARVRDFMLGTFDFMLNTTDAATGDPADGNRLVQEFAWFSLNYYEFNLQTYVGLNGNLFDHDSRQLMPLGVDYANYVKSITKTAIDLTLTAVDATPVPAQVNTPVLFTATFANQGEGPAQNVAVRFWNGDPRSTGQLLGTAPVIIEVAAQCTPNQATFTWTPTQAGVYTVFAELQASNIALDRTTTNNYAAITLTVAEAPTATPTATPTTTVTATPTATVTALPTASTTPSTTLTPTPTTTPTPSTTTPTPSTTTPTTATPTPTPTTSTQPVAAFTFSLVVTPTQPLVGGELVYTLQYSNEGLIDLEGMAFRLTIPAYTRFNSEKSTPGWNCLQASAGNPCQFVLGQVASQASGTIQFALSLSDNPTGISPPIRLTVQAINATQTVNIEHRLEVTIQGQESYSAYLPIVGQ